MVPFSSPLLFWSSNLSLQDMQDSGSEGTLLAFLSATQRHNSHSGSVQQYHSSMYRKILLDTMYNAQQAIIRCNHHHIFRVYVHIATKIYSLYLRLLHAWETPEHRQDLPLSYLCIFRSPGRSTYVWVSDQSNIAMFCVKKLISQSTVPAESPFFEEMIFTH